MTGILKDLKDHLYAFKDKNDSFSDVTPKLEESLLKANTSGQKNSYFKQRASFNKEDITSSHKENIKAPSKFQNSPVLPKPNVNKNKNSLSYSSNAKNRIASTPNSSRAR